MAFFRNERKLPAVSKETPKITKSSQSQNKLDPEMAQEYISQVSEEIKLRVTKKPSKEFSRTQSHILGVLSKLDDFLLNPQVRTCLVTIPGTSRNSNSENREPTEDRSLDDPCPETRFSSHHTGNLSSSKVEEYPHMVTRVQKTIRNRPQIMPGFQEEIPYSSRGTSSGKQKKARSSSQPQFGSENTPATIGADQILLSLQQLATNSNSANFNNNIKKISKLPKSLTTTMPTFDGKSEKIELFEDQFQTSLKIYNQLTEEGKKSTYTLSCVLMHYKLSKTSPAPTERIWEKF